MRVVTQRLQCTKWTGRGTTRPSPILRSDIRCQSSNDTSGFGGEGRSKSATAGGKKKKGKRGKVSSRPSPKEQLKQLQEDERLYREQMEQKYASNVVKADVQEQEEAGAVNDTVPEQITDRMLRRIALFSGGPIVFGMLLFPLFYYIKKVQGIDLPVWAVYIVQTSVFGGGLLGISYGIISSSWDPQREGSLLGWNEFQANLPLVLNRFGKKQ